MSERHTYLVTCPKGLESLIEQELLNWQAEGVRQTVAGVYCQGPLELGYRLCLWSRLANRVLLILDEWQVQNIDELYDGVKQIDWLQHIQAEGTLAIDFSGRLPGVNHSHFGAQRVKDAIVDQIREQTGRRPSIDAKQPDIRVAVHVHRHRATLSLDLAGESLHRRGYRLQSGIAPMKENLASALLLRAAWPDTAAKGGRLLDPMCGSGTILLEAAQMALDIAPGLARWQYGFMRWKQHDNALWQRLREEAQARKEAGLERGCAEIRGYDADPRVIKVAEANIERAGLAKWVKVMVKEVAALSKPSHVQDQAPGLLICNPPYGERLSDTPVLVHLYRHLGERLIEHFQDWNAAVFTGNPELGKQMRLRSHKQYKFFNGALPCELLLFKVEEPYIVRAVEARTQEEAQVQLSEGASMFANRLRKNLKGLSKWVKKEQIDAYRLYDADMPEYAVAIDLYHDYLHVQEYAPPKSINADKAQQRLNEVLAALPVVTGIRPDRIVLKQRQRQAGRAQYERLDQQGKLLEVVEEGCKLLVNLTDYLDTGLFLDHRPVRRRIQQLAKDKHVLNLFCYTATATVHAAKGGARSTTSVDMSRTYLDWGRKNLAVNGFSERFHRFEQADCFKWLDDCKDKFDLIFMDPPSFSNSKRMDDVLDIQRDHVRLIRMAMRCLAPGGLLIFSNNLRTFSLDREALHNLDIQDVTKQSFDPDFARNTRIHQCFDIRAKNG